MVNNYITYLSGGISGIIEIFFVHPLEYYKTVRQCHIKNIHFNTFFTDIYRDNGIKGLYKGFLPRFLGIIPMRTVFWGTLITSENELKKINTPINYIPLLSGMIAGFSQTIIDCPIESLKTKIMLNNNIKNINFSGFYPNLLRNTFFAMIFNIQKNKMERFFKKKSNSDIITGSVCGITSSFITQPFDYLKTQQQLYNEKTIIQLLKENNRLINYWRGGLSRSLITCLSMSIGLPVFNFINYKIFNNK